MAVVVIENKVTPQDIKKAGEDYKEYIKIIVDVKTKSLAIGGQWHADAEQELLKLGSRQENIWGGGIDIKSKKIEMIALINIRPRLGNNSQEILDKKVRKKFIKIVKEKFGV